MSSDGPAKMVLAVAQTGFRLGDHEHNLEQCVAAVRDANEHGADLVVLPECALTGYMFDNRAAAAEAALPLDHNVLRRFEQEVRRASVHAVVGLLEATGPALHNTAVLIGPEGPIGRYRKAHIPGLGADRFVQRGADLEAVFDTKVGKIGLAICYDVRFPESIRGLALRGAEIVAQPANIGVGGPEITLDHLVVARALENSVFVAVANRCDTEAGVTFCGRSCIVAPDGTVAADAGAGPGVALSEVDVSRARAKRREVASESNQIVVDLFGDRRPDLYGGIVAPPEQEPSVPESVAP